jgi:hypothetical protein
VRKRIYVGFVDPLAGTDLMFGTRYSATCESHTREGLKKWNTKKRSKKSIDLHTLTYVRLAKYCLLLSLSLSLSLSLYIYIYIWFFFFFFVGGVGVGW